MNKNKLLIAGAGTGKTTYLIEESLKVQDKRVLITTYTINCRNEIESKIINKIGYIPNNIVIQTWFSFLMEHGIRPYKKILGINEVAGIHFVEGKSGLKYKSSKGFPVYYGENEFDNYYFDINKKIYTDKLSKLVIKINEKAKGLVIDRISKIYEYIFIDEVQDMVGYDLEIIKSMLSTQSNIKLVGDPRQNVYNTHHAEMYKKYSNGNIDDFLINECKNIEYEIDDKSLTTCYRCYKDIINFVNVFYQEYGALKSIEKDKDKHQGVFIITKKDVDEYLEIYNPIQLIYDSRTKINQNYRSTSYGKSKGATYERVLLYPTGEFKKYLKGQKCKIDGITKNKLYVAMTRAEKSLAFVCDDLDNFFNFKNGI